MALTPTITNSQGFVQTVAESEVNILASQLYTLAVINFPTATLTSSQQYVNLITEGETRTVCASQAFVQVLVRGVIDDPVVRAWTYTLDGHDYYVLNLGDVETLVYDLHSKQWSTFSSADEGVWRAYQGANWEGGMKFASEQGSNVLCGDNPTGTLYFLDPDLEIDDDAVLEGFTRPFLRRATAQLNIRGDYSRKRVGMVELLGSIGSHVNAALNTVTLKYSDDRGNNYVNAGTVTVPQNDRKTRIRWRSLGSLRQPGRLFEIQDYGVLTRIDRLTAVLPDMKE